MTHVDRPSMLRLQKPWLACGLVLGTIGLWYMATIAEAANVLGAVDIPNALAAASVGETPTTSHRVGNAEYQKTVIPFLKRYCFDCHGADTEEAGIGFHKYKKVDSLKYDRKTWERVLKIVRVGAMPPKDYDPQPDDEERSNVIGLIDSALNYVDCSRERDPGRVTVRRLNRAEYDNTIRDLIGLNLKPAVDFPSDDVGEGFDNIGDVLSLSPLLFEKYLAAAEMVASKAITAETGNPAQPRIFDAGQLKGGGVGWKGFRSLASAGAVFGEVRLLYEGEYKLRVEAAADQAGPDLAKVELRVAGKKVGLHEVKGEFEAGFYESQFTVAKGGDIPPGNCKIEALFVNDYYKPDAKDKNDRDRNLMVNRLELYNPDDRSRAVYPDVHQRIIFSHPSDGQSAKDAARDVLSRFLKRAFRRPQSSGEIERYVNLVSDIMARGDSFERAIQLCVQTVLVSPKFLFRIENDPLPDDPAHRHDIDQYELASRLSYFLWSSMPDDELFALADKGNLSNPEVLRHQVDRMLADEKSQALVDNFASQWLNLRLLDAATPSKRRFPNFSGKLRKSMRRETELFFETVLRENRSIFDFMNADFTFVNEQLAKHYGIEGVAGNQFQRVSLTGTGRSGVLTHASILTLTSDSGRTLPVKRGKWIMENFWGQAPPEPPAGVPALDDVKKSHPDESLREQLARHRADPACATCHTVMDPIGLGLENFDAIGQWRDKENKRTIDPAGDLPGSGAFSTPAELLALIAKREDDFSQHLTRTLLTYALGRGLHYFDKCATDQILIGLRAGDFRMQTLIHEIVRSEPFLMRRGEGTAQ